MTESQTLKGTQYRGGRNFFVPVFNKLPYLLRSQGDKLEIMSKISQKTGLKSLQAYHDLKYNGCCVKIPHKAVTQAKKTLGGSFGVLFYTTSGNPYTRT